MSTSAWQRPLPWLVPPACLVALFACSGADWPAMPQAKRPDPVYYGLTRNSYGPRIVLRDPRSATVAIRSCDPTANQQPELAEGVRTFIASAAQGVTNSLDVDDTIKKQQMVEYFRLPNDPGFGPTVAIIDPLPGSIAFWHVADLVTLAEVSHAANAFCTRQHLTARYLGTATRCQKQQMPVVVNGRRTDDVTFAISEFKCT
jgi:hypothetical protein